MNDPNLLQFTLADGTPVFVESPKADFGISRVSRGGETRSEDDRRFEQALARIRPAAQAVLDSLRELNMPEEIGLEFGVKFSASAGVVFASADSEATFKVSLKWKNPV